MVGPLAADIPRLPLTQAVVFMIAVGLCKAQKPGCLLTLAHKSSCRVLRAEVERPLGNVCVEGTALLTMLLNTEKVMYSVAHR